MLRHRASAQCGPCSSRSDTAVPRGVCASTRCGPRPWAPCERGWPTRRRVDGSSCRHSRTTSRGHQPLAKVLVAMRVAAPPARTFAVFTGEIGEWWQPNGLFRFTDRDRRSPGVRARAPRASRGDRRRRRAVRDRRVWSGTHRTAWSSNGARPGSPRTSRPRWRSVDLVATGTRVTVEHFGWTPSRKSTPPATGSRCWLRSSSARRSGWQDLLRRLGEHVSP